MITCHFKNSYFHHALLEIRHLVLDDLYGNDFLRLYISAFYYLSKRACAENIQNYISAKC